MKNIKLELTIEEVNTVLEALSTQPFIDVYKLIEKIHLQSKDVIDEKDKQID